MHVKAKHIATAGLLVAVTVVLIHLGTVLEMNTLFFIIAAAFCVGIAIREWGLKLGAAFWVASVLVNVLFAPNKFYCITFAGMGLYIWFGEFLWKKIADKEKMEHRTAKLWIGKYLFFNVLYIPTLFLMPTLLFTKEITEGMSIILLLVGQIALFVFEVAYEYFQERIWGKMRVRFLSE